MSERRIALFDLDHTLYESSWSWRKSLQALVVDRLGNRRFPWSAYFGIRGHSNVFDVVWEKSFRHHWLTPELASLMLLIREGRVNTPALLEELESVEHLLGLARRREVRPGRYLLAGREIIGRHKAVDRAIRIAAERAQSHEAKELVTEYYAAVRIQPYAGVRQGLQALKDRNIGCYLASEGDYALHQAKLRMLNLERFFRDKVLASEIYTSNRLYRRHRRMIIAAIDEGTYLKNRGSHELSRADEEIRKYELIKHKENFHYYYAILNAIAANRDTPEHVLLTGAADRLLKAGRLVPDSIVMIGDRVDKDMYPVWKIFDGHAALIRVRSGKYRRRGMPRSVPRKNYRECTDLRQAFALVGKFTRG